MKDREERRQLLGHVTPELVPNGVEAMEEDIDQAPSKRARREQPEQGGT